MMCFGEPMRSGHSRRSRGLGLLIWKLALVAALSVAAPDARAGSPAKWHPGHYVFVGHGKIGPEHLAQHFRGVQKCYAWNLLEPEHGRYDFSAVRSDLALLQRHGKRLVLQLQYKAFGKDGCYAPAYLRGPGYGGGVYRASSGSLNPVLWNAKVGERMDALSAALGRELDREPVLEAVVLPETAPSANLAKSPQDGVEAYTPIGYMEALKQRMLAVRRAFPNTVVIQYANYPPDLLEQLTDYMKEIGVGLGGPDVYPRPDGVSDPKKGVYRLYPKMSGVVPLGAAVQSPDYSVANKKRTAAFDRGHDRNSVAVTPEEETPIPVREHLRLAQEKLKLNYLFWAAHPKGCLDNVKRMLAEPDLAKDPAGGLDGRCPPRAFLGPAK